MNKNLKTLLLSLSMMSTSAFSEVLISENNGIKNYFFSVDGIKTQHKIIEGENFVSASLVGVKGYEGVNYEIGSPEVPVIRFLVKADKAQDIVIASTTLKSTKNLALRSELKPTLNSIAKIPGTTYKVFKNKNFKSINAYPAQSYSIEESGSVRGQKHFMITLYPVQYVATTNTLKIVKEFEVSIKDSSEQNFSGLSGIVFIVGEKFKDSPSLKNYIELKKSTGFNTYVMDMPRGVSADVTRTQLKNLYAAKSDLQYALIIGDASDVPGKTSSIISGLTDHYFSAIDTDKYLSDINAPDIAVGRIAVTDEEQLATVLRKYTRYITGDFQSTNWLLNASFLATNDRYQIAEGSHNYVIETHTAPLGYTGTFPSVNQVGGDKLYAITNRATTNDVMTSITKGRAIINYSGHGATTLWDGPRVLQSDVRTLDSSSSSLPFVISNACITGDYRVAESFAETWQRQEWGAVMFWGSMDSTYWDEDDILEKRMYDGIFTQGRKTFGDITTNALSELWKQYGGRGYSAYYWETYHMFGDPSVSLRIN